MLAVFVNYNIAASLFFFLHRRKYFARNNSWMIIGQ